MRFIRPFASGLFLSGMVVSTVSTLSADQHTGPSPSYFVDGVELSQFPPLTDHFFVRWELVDGDSGEIVPPPDGIVTEIAILLSFDPTDPGEIVTAAAVEGASSFVFHLPGFEPPADAQWSYHACVRESDRECGDQTTGPLESPGDDYQWEPTGEECDDLFDELIRTREEKAAHTRHCDELKEALDAAREAKRQAHHEMEVERARRQEVESEIAELVNRTRELNERLDELEREHQEALEALRDAIQQHWNDRAHPDEAVPLHLGDLSDEAPGPWIVFTVAPGIQMSYAGIRGASEARHEHWARLTEQDLQARFAHTSAFRDLVEQIENLRDEFDATLDELRDAEAELEAAIQAIHQDQPKLVAYGEAVRDYEAARKAYEDCLKEKERLCEKLERLTREIERCERLRDLARGLREAEEAEEEARGIIEEAEGILDGIPERYRGGAADEARDRISEAEEKADEAGDLRGEAQDLVRDPADRGDAEIEMAEDLAEEARQRAEEARQRAEEARARAREARERADELIAEELREQKRKMREFQRWQERRAAALQYLLKYHFENDGSPEEKEVEAMHEALKRFKDLGESLSEAVEAWLDLTPGETDFTDLLRDLQEKVDGILGPLGEIVDAVSDVAGLFDTLAEISGHIRVLAGGGHTPEERAQQFASLMSLISIALDEAAGKAPILQFVSGYFDFLLQGFLAAQQLKEHLADHYRRMLERIIPPARVLIQRLVNGECHVDIVERLMRRQEVRILIDGTGFTEEQIRELIEGLVGEALVEAVQGQLRESPPPLPYGDWILVNPSPQTAGSSPPAPATSHDPLDPLANPGGDGIPNFAKYHFALDPHAVAVWPVVAITLPFEAGGDPAVAVRFPRLRGAVGVEVFLEFTKDIADSESWEPVETVEDFYPGPDGDMEDVVLYPQPPQTVGGVVSRGFYRLRLHWAEDP